jgi:predicted alpha/beta superfamily hydrolase
MGAMSKALSLALSLFAAVARGEQVPGRQVTFEITAPEPLPEGGTVFITGGDPSLGNWAPDAVPLTRGTGGVWTVTRILPADGAVEFKVTRGSWDSEEILADGSVPPNHVLPPGGASNQTVRIEVRGWKKPQPPPEPKITGRYRVHDAFTSRFLRFDRRVIVWLPFSYEKQTKRRYPALYMHDGQQVFDPQTSTHGVDWGVDETCTRLIAEGKLQEIIVVGSYCTADRFAEYDPADQGTNYTRFMIEELKPFIDRTYRTLPDRDHTAVAGSSMGGKISFYLAWMHPEVFFGAACLSPAFVTREKTDLEIDLVRDADRPTPDIKLYMYCGGADELEQRFTLGMRQMHGLLRGRGIEDGESLLVVEDPAAVHNEAAWAKVTGQWLLFLFGKK